MLTSRIFPAYEDRGRAPLFTVMEILGLLTCVGFFVSALLLLTSGNSRADLSKDEQWKIFRDKMSTAFGELPPETEIKLLLGPQSNLLEFCRPVPSLVIPGTEKTATGEMRLEFLDKSLILNQYEAGSNVAKHPLLRGIDSLVWEAFLPETETWTPLLGVSGKAERPKLIRMKCAMENEPEKSLIFPIKQVDPTRHDIASQPVTLR